MLVLILLLPLQALAQQFSASVNKNDIAFNERLILELQLADSKATSDPDFSGIRRFFNILGNQQSSSINIINGKSSSTYGWKLTLVAKTKGAITIPAVSIETDNGTLSTKPIVINVGDASSLPSSDQQKRITVSSSVSKDNPYKNESILYRMRVNTKTKVNDPRISELKVDNAFVTMPEEAKVKEQINNGIKTTIIEADYIITPLKAGKITITSPVFAGHIIQPNRRDPFDNFPSSFGMLRNFTLGNMEQISLAGDEIVLDVQAPASASQPWLPLTSLTVQDDIPIPATIKVGEPIERKLILAAEGTSGNQLPSLENQQTLLTSAFKVYAESPITKERVINGRIIGSREEQYTIIPQQAGQLTLPKMTVAWWDVTNDRMAYATTEPRVINVLPAAKAPTSPPEAGNQTTQLTTTPPPPATKEPNSLEQPQPTPSPTLYIVIALLVVILLFVAFWVLTLQKRIAQLRETGNHNTPKPKHKSAKAQPHHNSLASITTVDQMQTFIQQYAHDNWGTSKNASLRMIMDHLSHTYPDLNLENFQLAITQIEQARFAGKDANINETKEHIDILLKNIHSIRKNTPPKKLTNTLPKLNPS